MSVRSMTGFGSGSARGAGTHVAAEISSVNRKSLDIRISLPPALRHCEGLAMKLIAAKITRGSVSCALEIEWSQKRRAESVELDEPLARAYLDAIRGSSKHLGLEGAPGPELLLQLPNVVRAKTPAIDADELEALVGRAVTAALRKLDNMRRREGAELGRDLAARIDALENMARAIARHRAAAGDNHRSRLAEALAQAGAAPDEERLLRELVIFADKSDIAEELTRLDSHFKQARGFIKSREPAGRPLEFLSQELLREINTIASKSSYARISALAIEFKSELERLREQIRNIE
jgi:uncharacterized protein (TIGR00255 family)